MSELMMWRRIPPGCHLEVGVIPAEGEFAAAGKVFTYGGGPTPDEDWPDKDLRPGPKSFDLKSKRDYVVDILVSFASALSTSATVQARVVKADGSVYSKPDERVLKGKNGDAPGTVSIVLISQKAAR